MSEPNTGYLSTRQLRAAVRQQVRRGCRGSQVVGDLVRGGVPADAAETLVQETLDSARSGAEGIVVLGIIMVVLGIIVTYASYASAATQAVHSGGHVVFFWVWFGPVVVGVILVILGVARVTKYRW
jgi:hypothetical protein